MTDYNKDNIHIEFNGTPLTGSQQEGLISIPRPQIDPFPCYNMQWYTQERSKFEVYQPDKTITLTLKSGAEYKFMESVDRMVTKYPEVILEERDG